MVATPSAWVPGALKALSNRKVLHRNYEHARKRLIAARGAVLRGELVVLVGPSRVGKTRCVHDALEILEPNEPTSDGRMPVVLVEASNDSRNGEFSTKAFMVACLRAIRHPIFGVPDADDPWEERLQARLHRTPEGTLRAAFERALKLRQTEVIVFDEAQHVRYAPGGDHAAARILDSYKSLANRTKVKLVLSGSYQLLDLLLLAPHLLGRQIPLEFPRYRADSRADVAAWQQVLRTYSKYLKFENGESLCDWAGYLVAGSQGCVGQLLAWLRAALADLSVTESGAISRALLEVTRKPSMQEGSILAEILNAEQQLGRFKQGSAAKNAMSMDGAADGSATAAIKRDAHPRKPFQRKSRRNPIGGRV